MHQSEVWCGVDESACLSEELSVRLRLSDIIREWVEHGCDLRDGVGITILEMEVEFAPTKEL